MKKIYLVCILTLFFNSIYSQEVLTKLFEFRLGMTVDELKEVVDTTYLKKHESLRIINEGNSLNGRIVPYSLERYRLATNYSIERIILAFFDGKLYDIKILKYSPKTEELLTRKYGEPRVNEEKRGKISPISKSWKTNKANTICNAMYFTNEDDERLDYRLSLTDFKIKMQILDLSKK